MENAIEFLIKDAKENPNKLFVCDNENQYTYGSALEIVSRIACFFADKNIKNKPIMFKAERNCASILTLFGIIYSNNYYVPVNPAYAEEKIGSIIDSSNIQYAVSFSNGGGV